MRVSLPYPCDPFAVVDLPAVVCYLYAINRWNKDARAVLGIGFQERQGAPVRSGISIFLAITFILTWAYGVRGGVSDIVGALVGVPPVAAQFATEPPCSSPPWRALSRASSRARDSRTAPPSCAVQEIPCRLVVARFGPVPVGSHIGAAV